MVMRGGDPKYKFSHILNKIFYILPENMGDERGRAKRSSGIPEDQLWNSREAHDLRTGPCTKRFAQGRNTLAQWSLYKKQSIHI